MITIACLLNKYLLYLLPVIVLQLTYSRQQKGRLSALFNSELIISPEL